MPLQNPFGRDTSAEIGSIPLAPFAPNLRTGAACGVAIAVVGAALVVAVVHLAPLSQLTSRIAWPVSAAEFATFASVFAGSLVAGVAGFAFSAVAGALLLHVVVPTSAVPLLLACSITTQLFSIVKLRRKMEWRRCIPLLAGGIVGIPLGARLLTSLPPHGFAALFGAFLVLYSAYMLLRPQVALLSASRWMDTAAGFAGGITGGAIAFPGAFPTIWYSLRGFPKDVQRGVVQPFILVMQVATLAYFSKFGLLTAGTGATYLACVPAILCGTGIGLHLFRRINDAAFRKVVLVMLLASGTSLVL
jgi:uncharacterized membrane protein YfcA